MSKIGRFGEFGGQYVPETVMNAVHELEEAYDKYKNDPQFQKELADLYRDYANRPSMLYYAQHMTEDLGGAKIYIKREDLNHTGAHKINNVLGQILLAKRMGKKRIIAETGAGQHGVATATVCALMGLECCVYMGREDTERQSLNVYRMELLGAKVVPLSGPDGYCYDPDGICTQEKLDYMLEMRASGRNKAQDYADKFGVKFVPGKKSWEVKGDICMPAAYQNEIGMPEAEQILANGTKYYIEVANMPTTNEALFFLMGKGLVVAPSKAVNAGGVATSGLEMSQNSERLAWKAEEVDSQLHHIMTNIHAASAKAAEECGLGYNLVAGANIAGFKKVADAMMAQGLV